MPALTSLFGEAAWWPGRRMRRAAADDLFAEVAARAGIGTTQAESATHAALSTLAERITRNETRALATRLPRGLEGEIRRAAARSPERFGADEFVHRMADREGVPEDEARRHARAVLTTLEANAPTASSTSARSSPTTTTRSSSATGRGPTRRGPRDRCPTSRPTPSPAYAAKPTPSPLRIDQHAGVEQPGGVERVLGGA